MDRYTYRDLLRVYADGLRNGTNDRELTPRQRRLAAVALATASNDGRAAVLYPPTDQTREDVARAMGDALWTGNARAFADAISPATGEDLGVAIELAATVLRNI